MKLQYLGDYRDAFKWDLLHVLAAEVDGGPVPVTFVPMLTPDDPEARDGQIHHTRFDCRPHVRGFLENLTKDAAGLRRVSTLGGLDPSRAFDVHIHAPSRFVPSGSRRDGYWDGLRISPGGIVFLDPDNGFETRTRRGPKWVLHREVESLLNHERSCVVVYQHRPRRTWDVVLSELADRCTYASFASAVYDSSLAFIILTRSLDAGIRFSTAAATYAAAHPSVSHIVLTGEPT